ncbi:hypothetical protein O3G_MSEX010907 [Manduca sexta]|uniref:THAP-type domain-containing protein n=1 Tax=Manduca sexta TaxID=7130 RepID=A0A921ZIS2_MANSE|nr:hypothetical protein O3G_MSEX010907 [Manduca sexta]KAG6458506.1 hypothetical protein O3G_MSEX010907 [Manduca sexta]
MDHSRTNKCCAVPLCQSTSSRTPQKLFIHVPLNVKRRNLWLRLAKRNPKKVIGDAEIYFCEDHFDLETDISNYLQYKMGSTKEIKMVPGCIPTKFKCQMNHKLSSKSRDILVTKKLLDLTEEQKKQSETTTSGAQTIAEIKSPDVGSTNTRELKSDSGKIDHRYLKYFSTNESDTITSFEANDCTRHLHIVIPFTID